LQTRSSMKVVDQITVVPGGSSHFADFGIGCRHPGSRLIFKTPALALSVVKASSRERTESVWRTDTRHRRKPIADCRLHAGSLCSMPCFSGAVQHTAVLQSPYRYPLFPYPTPASCSARSESPADR